MKLAENLKQNYNLPENSKKLFFENLKKKFDSILGKIKLPENLKIREDFGLLNSDRNSKTQFILVTKFSKIGFKFVEFHLLVMGIHFTCR